MTKGWKNVYFLAKKSWKNACFCPKRLENSSLVSVVTLSQEFRSKIIDETTNYFLEKLEQNESMSRKYKKVYTTLNYFEHFLVLASAVTGCISIFAFASLLGISIGIMRSAIGLKICAVTARVKKYKSIIKKKKTKDDEIIFLAKSILNSIG